MEGALAEDKDIATGRGSQSDSNHFQHFVEAVRRAFVEFLTIPTLVILGFLGLGALLYYLDQMRVERDWPTFVFGSNESISTLLGTIASSIITVTSITFSLLLIAVQQSAAALTGQVYDQFLRRRANQAYFGFFIGLALYALIILATVEPDYTPFYGASVAFFLTVIALYLLILLIYSTIDQMRPVAIIDNIRDHSLSARKTQRKLLAATREPTGAQQGSSVRLPAKESGFITSIDVDRLGELSGDCLGSAEIRLLHCIGDYVSIGEELIEVRGSAAPDDDVRAKLLSAIRLERRRDLGTDPGFGIEQMANIAWTTVSTSKQNPEPGKLVCRALRDLVAYWYGDGGEGIERAGPECRIAVPDRVPSDLIRAFETLAVVASESMQHHVLAEAYQGLALAAERLPADRRAELQGVVDRSISALGEHVLTAELDGSIATLAAAMDQNGYDASALREARDKFAVSWGELHSRATRSTAWQPAKV